MAGRGWQLCLAAVVAASAVTASCAYAKSCDIRFPPQEAPQVKAGEIVGRVYALCDKPPESHHLEYWLERRNTEGAFVRVGPSLSSDRIPGKRRTTYDSLVLPCEPGVWRVAANINGSLDGRSYAFKTNSGHLVVAASDC